MKNQNLDPANEKDNLRNKEDKYLFRRLYAYCDEFDEIIIGCLTPGIF